MRYDLHTHSTYSDGKDTLEANIEAAIKKGLTKIGLTDHAYRHQLEGVPLGRLDDYLSEAYALKEKYKKDIDVIVGMEFNLLDIEGRVDIPKGYEKAFELKLLGSHKAARYGDMKSYYYLLMVQALKKERQPKKVIEIATGAYIKAVERYKIDILAHPGYVTRVDMGRLAAVCEKTGTLIEINARHQNMTDTDIRAVLDTGAKFILGSDGHRPEAIGVHEYADRFIKANDIPLERIVNADEA